MLNPCLHSSISIKCSELTDDPLISAIKGGAVWIKDVKSRVGLVAQGGCYFLLFWGGFNLFLPCPPLCLCFCLNILCSVFSLCGIKQSCFFEGWTGSITILSCFLSILKSSHLAVGMTAAFSAFDSQRQEKGLKYATMSFLNQLQRLHCGAMQFMQSHFSYTDWILPFSAFPAGSQTEAWSGGCTNRTPKTWPRPWV